MNKKLIAIGIAAVLAVPFAAQAGVEVYGQARVSVDLNNNSDDNTSKEKSNMSLSSNASRLGFKGDEDLGGGNSLLWQYETGVTFDTGTMNAEQRQTFVGVAGGFGTVLGGRLDTPYKSATNSWDPFVDTKADYNALMGGNVRASNALAYVTPNLNGFTGALAYVMPSAVTGDGMPMTKTEKKESAYSLSGNYAQGPLNVAVGYEVLNKLGSFPASGTEKDNNTSWKVGATYAIMDATTLGLIYENQDMGGTVVDKNNIYFFATHKVGDTTLKLAYTKADKWSGTDCSAITTGAIASCDKTGATQISVGASHNLTKNTEVYALYSQISNDDNISYGLNGGPGAVTKVSGVASDPSVLSVGINHHFSSK